MSSASNINLTEVLKKIFNEEAEILIETDAEIMINFKEKINLIKKLTQADNDAALII